MDSATTDYGATGSAVAESAAPSRSKRRNTSHLKLVPETRELRDSLQAKCRDLAARLDKSRPLTKDEMEQVVREFLTREGMPEGYLGWAMVVLASEFWRDQVAATPPSRRLFLLPHCLKHAEGCPADYDEFGLDCRKCGACSIADFRTVAEDMGYKVLVAEGSPIVLKIIVGGYVDAVVGVACLNVLEKAIDKILLAGIPCMAVPLLSSDCRNTSVDQDWVQDMIHVLAAEKNGAKTDSYVHLMRTASKMFEPEELDRLAPRIRSKTSLASKEASSLAHLDPIAGSEAIAYDFLAKGGKYSRPFITLATYDALTGAEALRGDPGSLTAKFTDSVKRAAMSIETFHKASLVHDDIEDDDQYRYGAETVHRRFGVPTAINVGDYLIGLGYRLVSRESKTLGADVAADILDCLAESHMRLAEGQGAELLWRDRKDKQLKPIDALKIYALKTAPAFEAAFFTGIRLAQPYGELVEPVRQFARNLGVAFQILNDLGDWSGDSNNKLAAGLDTLGGRPTVLWALALESTSPADRAELLELVGNETLPPAVRVERVRLIFERSGVFDMAHKLVDKHEERARAIAEKIEPEPLRRLFHYLLEVVLERPSGATPAVVPLSPLSIVAAPLLKA